ncbi:DUF5666 domain-containing protein [Variovorax humicola]|uniref:DUF5666 domain-containing protein n=1 Tax=Variovorax humicola TaxID=1769758 RepID=A0ABU8W9B7_9BURK
MTTTRLLRSGLLVLALTALLSCGGGGSGSVSGFGIPGSAGGSQNGALTGSSGTTTAGSADGSGGSTTAGSADGSSGGTTVGTTDGSGNGSTSTASNGDGSGVGSGGTGVTSASAVGVGSVDGFGSVIVNGLRYDIDSAVVTLEDAQELAIGMTARVIGAVDAGFTSGVARELSSAAELRGPLTAVDPSTGNLLVMGTTVTTDSTTVWADTLRMSSLGAGATLQIWGLPVSPGVLRATRIAQVAGAAAPIVTGTVQNLDMAARVFNVGGLVVDYRSAAFAGGQNAATLANGAIVRVRATQAPAGGVLTASVVQSWYGHASTAGTVALLEGVISEYTGVGGFKILDTPVDASAAKITGGPGASALGNGVKVIVGGTFDSNGRLLATTLKIRHVPGTGGPASFMLIGTVGYYTSSASFQVRGKPVDASGSDVDFVNGSAADLRNGTKVTVSGSQVMDGVLIATQVIFD